MFLSKLREESLNDQQIFCLQLFIADYEQGLLGTPMLSTELLVKKLVNSTTLGQLRPRPEIGEGIEIKPQDFLFYLAQLKNRISQLPLNRDVKECMNDIILPGIETMIVDEDKIIEHVTTHYGVLYLLNAKLPLHTDHTQQNTPEDYQAVLHRILISLFSTAECAHIKGRLHTFCEKLSVGYCLEGRLRDVISWAATLSSIVSFDVLMDQYINQQYIPYKQVMSDMHQEESTFVVNACDFIMARHKNNPCLPEPTYAPNGIVTRRGVRKYLEDVLNYTITPWEQWVETYWPFSQGGVVYQ